MLHRAMLTARLRFGRLNPQFSFSGAVNHYGPTLFYLGGCLLFYGGGSIGIATASALKSAVAEASLKDFGIFFAETIFLPVEVPVYNLYVLCHSVYAWMCHGEPKDWMSFTREMVRLERKFLHSAELKEKQNSIEALKNSNDALETLCRVKDREMSDPSRVKKRSWKSKTRA